MTWTEDVTTRPVLEVATALGLSPGRSHSLGPCPGCGATERGSSDRRGPIGLNAQGTGWRCHRCDAGGSALDLVSWSLFRGRLDKGDHRWGALRDRCLQLGLCQPGDAPTSSPTPRPRPVEAPPIRPPRAEVDALWAASARVDRLSPSDAAAGLFLDRRRIGPLDALARLDIVRVTPLTYSWPSWWPASRAATWRLLVRAYEADGTVAGVHARAIVETDDGKTRWPYRGPNNDGPESRRLLFASPSGLALLRGEAPKGCRVVVGEGLTGLLNGALRAARYGDKVAVLTTTSGGFPALADVAWPADAVVFAATDDTDHDGTGEKYARQIREAVPAHLAVRRVRWNRDADESDGAEKRDLGNVSDEEFDAALRAAQPMPVPGQAESGGQAEQVVDTTAEDALEDLRTLVAAVASAQGQAEQRELVAAFLEGQGPRGLALLEDQAPIAAAMVRLRAIKGFADEVRRIERAIRDAQSIAHVEPTEAPPRSTGRREIRIRPAIGPVTREALEALRDCPTLFQRAGELCTVSAGRGGARVVPVAREHLRVLLGDAAAWLVRKRKGDEVVEVEDLPPGWVVDSVATLPAWPGVRELEGIVEHPTLRPDGSLLDEPGYDDASGLFVHGDVDLRVPGAPRLDDAEAAVSRLHELLADFPFVEPHHRSAAIAALLTLVARSAIRGPVPMFVFSATAAGTGKGLLAHAIATIALGRDPDVQTCSDQDEEQRKMLTSIAIEGQPLVVLDNIVGQLGGANLDAAITSTVWADRKLGGNAMVRLPWRACLWATLNGLQVRGDLIRRVIPISLDARLERPEERAGFRFPRLLEHVRRHRGAFLGDALTILRAYIEAGRPRVQVAALGSFEAWSDLVRSAIVWAGEPDPVIGQAQLRVDADPASEQLAVVLRCWRAAYSDQPRTLAQVAQECLGAFRQGDMPSFEGTRRLDLYNALVDVRGVRRSDGSIDTSRLGWWLRSVAGRPSGGLRFLPGPTSHQARTWLAHPVTP